MEKKIRHRRLHAFYQSKVLNALMIVVVVSLLQIGHMQSLTFPALCASVAFALFIGYALWLWIKKPEKIVINRWLSTVNGWFTLYFLIVVAMKGASPWWYVIPALAAIVAMFICMVNPHDEVFEI